MLFPRIGSIDIRHRSGFSLAHFVLCPIFEGVIGICSTGCFITLAEGSGFASRFFHATRYTPISRQRRTAPARGSETRLCCCDIVPLSFIFMVRTDQRIQAIVNIVFRPVPSRSSFYFGIRIAFPLLISISAFLAFKKSNAYEFLQNCEVSETMLFDFHVLL